LNAPIGYQKGGIALLRPEDEMTNLTLVASRQATLPPAQWAHDIRNLLATLGLHLDSLARLSGPQGAKAASAAHALIARAGGMCGEAVTAAGAADGRRRRHPFDITAIIRQVVDLVAPLGPEGFCINVASNGAHLVLGDQTELFRVVFNLMHNALVVARSSAKLRRIDISVERMGAVTAVRVADDGGGLPRRVAARLFRGPVRAGALHGHGLAIARELMERNGGTLTCETSRKGTIFRVELAAFTSIRVAEGAVTRSLGQRAAS
jgi:signal transduction histidine kinase